MQLENLEKHSHEITLVFSSLLDGFPQLGAARYIIGELNGIIEEDIHMVSGENIPPEYDVSFSINLKPKRKYSPREEQYICTKDRLLFDTDGCDRSFVHRYNIRGIDCTEQESEALYSALQKCLKS
ncbi:hypothetical protein KA005_30485 [bacterium]|nr:hypothetical protein [bacterium]